MKFGKWLFAGLAWLVLVQAPASAAAREGMTPEGRAISEDVYHRAGAEFMAGGRKRRDTGKQINREVRSEHPDWKLLSRLIDQDAAERLRMRRLSRAVEKELLARLPEHDRIIYLRSAYPDPSKPPVIEVMPTPKPSQQPPVP